MDSKKIIIVVLVLIVVVFVILVARGSLTVDQPKQMNPQEAKKEVNNISSNWRGALDSLFGGFQQTVVLPCRDVSKSSTRQCDQLALGTINVPEAEEPFLPFLKKAAFRTAKLVRIDGRANISYRNNTNAENVDNPQTFKLPNPENNDSIVESLVILETGGILTISCEGNTKCQVGQQ